MRIALVCAVLFAFTGCTSDAERACFEAPITAPHRVSACGELCDKGDQKACGIQGETGLQRCMKDKDAETCRWMCSYGKDGRDLYCREYQKITGKPAQ